MAWAGAILVVISAAIFTVYRWESFSPTVKLLFLAGFTSAFYMGGDFVRVRLALRPIGISIMTAGAAMLLFDGWILMQAAGLEGPLPWAVVLLVCSIAYWLTELRVSGKFFGGIGATAQIGWWWLLGRGIEADGVLQVAVVAVIALAWSVVAPAMERRPSLSDLGVVLRWGAPLAAAVAVVASLPMLVTDSVTWLDIGAAGVLALCAGIVLERDPKHLPRGWGAVAVLPVLLAVVLEFAPEAPGAAHVALLGALAFVLLWAEYRVGRVGYGVLGLGTELLFWYALGWMLGLDDAYLPLVFALVAATWFAAAALLRRYAAPEAEGSESLAVLAVAGGWLVLMAATLATPILTRSVPYWGTPGRLDLAIAVAVAACWFVPAALERDGLSAYAASGATVYVVALASWVFLPGYDPASYAAILIAPVFVWSQARRLAERYLGLDDLEPLGGLSLFAFGALLVCGVGVGMQAAFDDLLVGSVGILLGSAAMLWLAEAVRYRAVAAYGVAAAGFTMAAIPFVGAAQGSAEWGAVGGAVSGLIASGLGLFGRRSPGAQSWSIGAAVAAVVATVATAGHPSHLAVGLLAAALAWLFAGVVTRQAAAFGVAALLGVGSLSAGLAWVQPESISAVVAVVTAGGLLAAPSLVARSGTPGLYRDGSLLVMGVGIGYVVTIAALGACSETLGADGWYSVGHHGVAALMVAGAGLTAAWSVRDGVDWGVYPTLLLGLLAVWSELAAFDVEWIEAYSTSTAVFLAIAGEVFARRRPENRDVIGVTDAIVAVFALGVPLFMSIVTTEIVSFQHAIWAGGLGLLMVLVGTSRRIRAYFLGGLATLVLDGLWQSREFIAALDKWILFGTLGIILLVTAVSWGRRRPETPSVTELARDAMSDWR